MSLHEREACLDDSKTQRRLLPPVVWTLPVILNQTTTILVGLGFFAESLQHRIARSCQGFVAFQNLFTQATIHVLSAQHLELVMRIKHNGRIGEPASWTAG